MRVFHIEPDRFTELPALPESLPRTGGTGAIDQARRLSPRQKDVLEWLLKGCTNHAIATALGISAETVKLHVSAIFRAYGVHSRTQLVLLCSRSPSVMAAATAVDDGDNHVAAPASAAPAAPMPQTSIVALREGSTAS